MKPRQAADLLAALAQANRRMRWQTSALCAQTDPTPFFTDDGTGVPEAKQICRNCPVLVECRAWALAPETFEHGGVWGGLSERERHNIRRRDRKAAA